MTGYHVGILAGLVLAVAFTLGVFVGYHLGPRADSKRDEALVELFDLEWEEK